VRRRAVEPFASREIRGSGVSVIAEMTLKQRVRRIRGPLTVFVIAVVVALTSYALTPLPTLAAGGYPGPNALPGVPTYGGVLGEIAVGHHSALDWVCGFDVPNSTNHSPKYAVAYINGVFAADLPIDSQYGCASFILYASLYNGSGMIAPCGYVYVEVNSGPWILAPVGEDDELLVTGIKHYQHVGAIFPFSLIMPPSAADYCPPPPPTTTTTTTTRPTRTTIPTTTLIPPTSSTFPGLQTTTSHYNAGSTSTVPQAINTSPTTTLEKLTEVITLIAVLVAAGAAAVGAGQFLGEIPESLVEEYTTEIEPGGGLPYEDFPAGGVGVLEEIDEFGIIPVFDFTEMPIGGGYPFGSSVPDATISEGYVAVVLEESDEDLLIFVVEDTDIPPGGGAPQAKISANSGGLSSEGDAETSSGGGAT
jgi:hypothetical protein